MDQANLPETPSPSPTTVESPAPAPSASTPTLEPAPSATASPSSHKGMAYVAYIIFFIPLLTDAKDDPFVKFHVKQGLTLTIVAILISLLGNFLPYSLWWIINLLNLGVLILFIIGLINVSKDKQQYLPLIGQFSEYFKF